MTKAFAVYGQDDCFLYSKRYPGPTMNNCADKTDTVKECHSLCERTEGCVQFTWMGHALSGQERECCLMNIIVRHTEHYQGVISGPKTCRKYKCT